VGCSNCFSEILKQMDKLNVIKIGGNIIDDEAKLSSFLQSLLRRKKILVTVVVK
jgi:acetylglutamate kinase